VQDGEGYLRDDMLRGDEVDVVAFPHVLELHVPFGELLGREVEAIALVGDVMVLAEYLNASIRHDVLDRFSEGEGVHIADYIRRRRRCQSRCDLEDRALGAISRHATRMRRYGWSIPSPKCGAIVLTFTCSAPIRHTPVFLYRFTPHSLGQRLQLLKCAYASERFFEASMELMRW
jgi:hypothetical protein